jgi:hypothetical protein
MSRFFLEGLKLHVQVISTQELLRLRQEFWQWERRSDE